MLRPRIGEMNSERMPTGATAMPAHVAVKPAVVCSQIGKITLAPMKAKYAKETHSVPIRKLRLPKKCKSMTGCRSVSSQGIRNVKLMSATIELVMMAGELNQSNSLPLSRVYCRLPTPTTSRIRPTASIGSLTCVDSRVLNNRETKYHDTKPTGTLI